MSDVTKQDVSIHAAHQMADDFKEGKNIPNHLYTLYMARVCKESLNNSSLLESLTTYSDHPGYGPMTKKLLIRFSRISKGEIDPLNKSREEEHGFGQKEEDSKQMVLPETAEKKKSSPKKDKKISKISSGKVQKNRPPFGKLENNMKAVKNSSKKNTSRRTTWEPIY